MTDVIAPARAEQRTILSEVEAKQMLADAGINVTETRLATSIDEACLARRRTRLPGCAQGRLRQDHAQDRCRRRRTGRRRRGGAASRLPAHPRTGHRRRARRSGLGRIGAADGRAGRGSDPRHHPGPAVRPGADVRPGRRVRRGAQRCRLPHRPAGAARRRRDDSARFRASRSWRECADSPPPTWRRSSRCCSNSPSFAEANPEVAELDLNPVFARPDGAIAVDARILLGNES